MDDPKNPSNEPVSPGSEEITTEVPTAEETAIEESSSETPESNLSRQNDASANPSTDGEEAAENADANQSAAPGDETPDQAEAASPETQTDSDDGVIKDSGEQNNDPYDPNDIYGDYNEYYEEEGYASPTEPMPERPDDPYQQEEQDRAAEENVVAAATLTAGEDVPKKDKPEKKPEEEDEEEDPFEKTDKELGGRMSFLDHLDELRKRIFHAMIAIIITFVVAWIFREHIFGYLSAPIKDVVDQLVVLRPTEPFTVYLKVSFAAAIFFAIPYIMFQVWLFIAPGLYRKEKIYALPFLFSSSVLFVVGGLFAYYIILPPALNFLLNEFGSEFKAMISAVEYYDFELIIIVGMGVIFQLPVIVAFLSMFGLVSPGFLWRNFKYAFLLITIIAAVVSPTTDPLNLFLWSGPMMVLYTISIGISWIFKVRRDKKKRLEDEKYS